MGFTYNAGVASLDLHPQVGHFPSLTQCGYRHGGHEIRWTWNESFVRTAPNMFLATPPPRRSPLSHTLGANYSLFPSAEVSPPDEPYAAASAVGSIHTALSKPSQDVWDVDHDSGIYVVADGNGALGDIVAKTVSATLMKYAHESGYRAFKEASDAVDSLENIKYHSGASATVAQVQKHGSDVQVNVSYIGSTSSLLVDGNGAHFITNPHNTYDLVEFARIHCCGGFVEHDCVMDDPCSPSKTLSSTRSLGRLDMHPCGVVPWADFNTYRVRLQRNRPSFLVLASGGFWTSQKEITPAFVASTLYRYGVRKGCYNLLSATAGSMDFAFEDCTVVVVSLSPS